MLGLQSYSAAGMLQHLENSIFVCFLPHPCQTYATWVVVVTLVGTGLISISEMLQQEGPLEGTCHPPHFLQ